MSAVLFRGMRLFDPRWDEPRDGYEVLVEGARIAEVSDRPIAARDADVIECGGRTLMPGLIDCHAHVTLSEVALGALEGVPLTLMTARAARIACGMLDRGFTTVRDMGGADWGIKKAIDDGILVGPRLFISGRLIGPTGGHSDLRRRTEEDRASRTSDALHHIVRIVDGAADVRQAVREQMRQGADQIKIMCSGGVASPYDPLDSVQLSAEEVRAATETAADFGRYVGAHAYTPAAITRAVENGVRTIEHGNLIDDAAAALLASKKGFLVANLVTYSVMKDRGARYGLTPDMLAKNDVVTLGALRSLEICKRAGVPVGYGSDLLGELHSEQSGELLARAEVLRPIEILRQATLVGAQILRRERELGIVEPGALADLIVVDGDPLQRLELFLDQGAHIPLVMTNGRIHRRLLS